VKLDYTAAVHIHIYTHSAHYKMIPHKQTHLLYYIMCSHVTRKSGSSTAVVEEVNTVVGRSVEVAATMESVGGRGGYNRLMFGAVQSISMQNARTHGHNNNNNNNNNNNFAHTHTHTHTPCSAGHYASTHAHTCSTRII